MPSRKKNTEAPPQKGYSDTAKTAVQEATTFMQEMHTAIVGNTFAMLNQFPMMAGPAQMFQSAHDAMTASMYAAINHNTGGMFEAAAMVEEQATGVAPSEAPGRYASGLMSAFNGAFGDQLAATFNLMAINMAIHVDGAPLELSTDALRATFPEASKRICLFIHGLGCDEHCWNPDNAGNSAAIDFGKQVYEDFGDTPLYLRYNTGLSIAQNGTYLAALLEKLLAEWPHKEASEIVIVGHSMGGLISLAACEQAAQADLHWPHATRMLICLGSPSMAPVDRLGELASSAMQPLGAAAKSKSSRDHIAFRFLGSTLSEDVDHPFSEYFGDGLVMLGSATDHEIEGDVLSARLGNISHMGLLNDQRVYKQIKKWMAALSKSKAK